ncbi:MAG: very short patch repair endonuclease [Deltaproteobacteria bacterium]|nr:very short patch repair endonuclease [Deltaproteobacteria bacterium]
MLRTRRRDTKPEMALRRELFRRGFRYRVDLAPLAHSRLRPDIVFIGKRVAIFVHGCFWHGCPDHATSPKANADWWRAKLDANMARDARHVRELAAAGWRVVRVWEHELAETAADRVAKVLAER